MEQLSPGLSSVADSCPVVWKISTEISRVALCRAPAEWELFNELNKVPPRPSRQPLDEQIALSLQHKADVRITFPSQIAGPGNKETIYYVMIMEMGLRLATTSFT